MEPRPVRASQVEMTEIVLPNDANTHGSVLGGRVLHLVDIAGAIAAGRHSGRGVVTASIDEVAFLHPARVGDVLVLRASVNFAARTSMEVGVRVWSEDPRTAARRHTASAYLTFVALGDDGRPTGVPAVAPETDEERRRHREAEARRAGRIRRREEKRSRVAAAGEGA